MVTEKSAAAAEAFGTLAFGGSLQKVMRRYRTHVRANKRRRRGADRVEEARKPPQLSA